MRYQMPVEDLYCKMSASVDSGIDTVVTPLARSKTSVPPVTTLTTFDPPLDEQSKRQFGYSRDHRPDCVQVVIALIITPEGFPLAYEVLGGNTADKTTLRDFLARIERQYGKARRIWLCDRGIPTEEGKR